MSAAFLDRLMHHSHLIEICGKSYRLHESSLDTRGRKGLAPAQPTQARLALRPDTTVVIGPFWAAHGYRF